MEGWGFGSLKGLLRLAIALAFVAVVLITVPESRWILLMVVIISVPIGIVVALVLRFWHKTHPLEEEDEAVQKKRPLGLDG